MSGAVKVSVFSLAGVGGGFHCMGGIVNCGVFFRGRGALTGLLYGAPCFSKAALLVGIRVSLWWRWVIFVLPRASRTLNTALHVK
ncbi:unnamed protein product [Staurois parvus]|uniref:Transmembrane protein n=1 Tax=Staurois parvus TaxID=386267 RepID=A0ABN9GSH8_9NEOB|nr:unnamed protein product [Staurois parvus]